jgi:hypothetical protein
MDEQEESRLSATLTAILGVTRDQGATLKASASSPALGNSGKSASQSAQRARNKFLVLNAQAMMRQPPKIVKHYTPAEQSEPPPDPGS